MSDANYKEEEASSSSLKQFMHYTNTLKHTLIILKCMIHAHVVMNFVSLSNNSCPH